VVGGSLRWPIMQFGNSGVDQEYINGTSNRLFPRNVSRPGRQLRCIKLRTGFLVNPKKEVRETFPWVPFLVGSLSLVPRKIGHLERIHRRPFRFSLHPLENVLNV
jgi:hypothetical protein